MLIVLAGSPGAAPLKTSLGEKPQAEILLVYLVREALCAVAVLSGCGGLDEPGAVYECHTADRNSFL